jgi:hypothetical protein
MKALSLEEKEQHRAGVLVCILLETAMCWLSLNLDVEMQRCLP